MSHVRKDPNDIVSIPADETIKLVFAADRVALIRFINAIFNKSYDTATPRFTLTNADFINSETFDAIYGDFMFSIDGDFYHIEFQTKYDKTISLRIFSYGAHKALETALSDSDDETVLFIFPQPLVIYLEQNRNISSELNAMLQLPNGQPPVAFKIPIIKMWELSVESLTEKEWYLLLPFTLISYRKKFERENGEARFKDEFVSAFRSLMKTISQLSLDGKISSYLEGILYGATKNLASYFNEKYINDEEFDKEVRHTMISKVRTFLDDVRDEGRVEGITLKGISVAVNSVKKLHCSVTDAMDVAELDLKYRDNVISELRKQEIAFIE
jgi:hypothetical protein